MRSGLVALVAVSVVAGIIAVALTQPQTATTSRARDTAAGASATAPVQATAPTGEAPSPGKPAPPPTGSVADVKRAPAASAPNKAADRAKAPTTKSAAAGKAGPSGTTKTTAGGRRPPVAELNRRVAILPTRVSTSREGVAAAVEAIDDSLKKAVAAAGYTLATDSELLRLMAQQNTAGGGLRKAADGSGIGAVVRVEILTRGDEVSAVTQVLDVWRAQTSSARDAADVDRPMELLNVVRHVARSLDRVSWRTRSDPRRVMLFDVSDRTGVAAFSAVARQLEDSLRAAVVRAGAVVVPLDSTARSTRDVVERRQLAIRRGAGAIVDAGILRARGDSVSVRLSVRDMTEERTLPTIETRLALRDIERMEPAIGQVAARLADALAQINWGPKPFH
jgi:hypothetical protein